MVGENIAFSRNYYILGIPGNNSTAEILPQVFHGALVLCIVLSLWVRKIFFVLIQLYLPIHRSIYLTFSPLPLFSLLVHPAPTPLIMSRFMTHSQKNSADTFCIVIVRVRIRITKPEKWIDYKGYTK